MSEQDGEPGRKEPRHHEITLVERLHMTPNPSLAVPALKLVPPQEKEKDGGE